MIKRLILYATVFLGCFFEGETSLVTSSFAAHRGYMEIYIVMIIAFTATLSWDLIWFTVGRKKGSTILAKRPKLQEKAHKIDTLLMKHPIPVLLGYRFLYGFRTAVPLAIGMSSVSKRKFLTFAVINTILWDCLFSSLGYFFGAFLKANWKRIEHDEFKIMAIIVIAGVITGLFLRSRSIKKVAKETEPV
jgi:membrane protein DedA with SNARE-associated domain